MTKKTISILTNFLVVIIMMGLAIAVPLVGNGKAEIPPVVIIVKKVVKRPVALQTTKNGYPLGTGNCEKYRTLIEQYKWDISIAMEICRKESHGDPLAINKQDIHRDRNGNIICVSSRGLFQIACFWPKVLGYTLSDLNDPEKNIKMAYMIWGMSNGKGDTLGFTPWSTYKTI